MPETATVPTQCKNCDTPVTEKFCPVCGQSRQVERLTVRTVFKEFVYDLLNLERGFFYTLRELTFRPGLMVRSYVTGRRRLYTKPLQFYLIMLALYFTVNEVLQIDALRLARDTVDRLGIPLTEPLSEQATNQILALVNQNIKIIYSVLILVLAFSLRLVYFNFGFNYVEMLSLSLYIIGYKYAFDLIAILALLVPLPVYGQLAIAGLASIASNVYLVWAIAQFMGNTNGWGILRALGALLLMGAIYGLLSTFLLKIPS